MRGSGRVGRRLREGSARAGPTASREKYEMRRKRRAQSAIVYRGLKAPGEPISLGGLGAEMSLICGHWSCVTAIGHPEAETTRAHVATTVGETVAQSNSFSSICWRVDCAHPLASHIRGRQTRALLQRSLGGGVNLKRAAASVNRQQLNPATSDVPPGYDR